MCLQRLDDTFQPCEVGYQVKEIEYLHPPYKKSTRRYIPLFKKGEPAKIGDTIKAERDYVQADDGYYYMSGFHVFHDLDSARAFQKRILGVANVIVKVRTGGRKITGWQSNSAFRVAKCTVAEEITLLKEV